jgi:hypothetical protein
MRFLGVGDTLTCHFHTPAFPAKASAIANNGGVRSEKG